MAITSHAPMLRGIAERLGVETVMAAARKPGVGSIYRATVHYYDRRARDVVATLFRRMGASLREDSPARATLEIMVDRALSGKPLIYTLDEDRYDTFVRVMYTVGFDKLGDQPDLPVHDTTDLWLIERAAGTFAHGVIVAPDLAQPLSAHARLINAVRYHLPEALRVLQ